MLAIFKRFHKPVADPDLNLRGGGLFALPAFHPSAIFFTQNKGPSPRSATDELLDGNLFRL